MTQRTQTSVPQSEKPVAESISAQRQQDRASPSETRSVCRVGGYEIQRELGRGATGIVHQAVQTVTGRKMALKIIVPVHADNQRAMQTFVREGSTLSQLDHPRIVRFYEMGIADGQLFLAMEYVDTLDFRAVLRDGSKTGRVKVACGIICQVLDALAYAHSLSLIHRDVKPSNILLTKVGRKLRTKLSDFGLAKNYLNAGLSGITPDAVAVGSLAYMAPEQIINARDAKPACRHLRYGCDLVSLPCRTPAVRVSPRPECVSSCASRRTGSPSEPLYGSAVRPNANRARALWRRTLGVDSNPQRK